MRSFGVVAMFAAMAFAGCVGGDDKTGTNPEGSDNAELPSTTDAPTWAIGDWWTFAFQGAGEVTWVVTEEQGPNWIVDVDDPATAFVEAAFDDIATVGAIAKSDLAGVEDGQRVQFFSWPLEDGKTWPMTWDGISFQATSHDVGEGAWHIVYEAADVTRNVMYEPDRKWFQSLNEVDGNGTVVWQADLQQHGTDYTGSYARYELHDTADSSITGFGSVVSNAFTVPPEATDIWLFVDFRCDPGGAEGDQGSWGVQVSIEDPTVAPAWQQIGQCPVPFQEVAVLDPVEGRWTLDAFGAGGSGTAQVIVRELQLFTL